MPGHCTIPVLGICPGCYYYGCMPAGIVGQSESTCIVQGVLSVEKHILGPESVFRLPGGCDAYAAKEADGKDRSEYLSHFLISSMIILISSARALGDP